MVVAPVGWLILLAALSVLLRLTVLRRLDAPTAAGASVMAAGIFVLAALQHLPGPVPTVTRVVGLELLLIWGALAVAYAVSLIQGTFWPRLRNPGERFAIGTWVAGTAVLAEALNLAVPTWTDAALAAALLAVLLWLWLLGLLAAALPRLGLFLKEHATGAILLPTVSTQAIVLAAHAVLRRPLPVGLEAALIELGALFYVMGVIVIGRRYLFGRAWRLADDWDNTNCILHGATSITGLAAITTAAFPLLWSAIVWLWVTAMLVFVESIEVTRAVARLRCYGWRRGIFTYHVSQWARNFTFGMYYAFNVALVAQLGTGQLASASWLRSVAGVVVSWGQYVVLACLLVEIGLFIDSSARGNRSRTHASRGYPPPCGGERTRPGATVTQPTEGAMISAEKA